MSNVKMSDVFTGEVVNDADSLLARGYGQLADFSGYKKEARYTAIAINAYDINQELIEKQQQRIDGQLKMLEVSGKEVERLDAVVGKQAEQIELANGRAAKARKDEQNKWMVISNKQQADNELLREAMTLMKGDLITRGHKDSQGCVVVDCGASTWAHFNGALAATAKG